MSFTRKRYWRDIDFEAKRIIIATTVGCTALSGAAGIGLGNLADHPHDNSPPISARHNNPATTPSAVAEKRLSRDLPSVVVNMGEVIPIATEARPYIVVEQTLHGPNDSPRESQHVDVTIDLPANTARRCYIGEQLTPQQTNDLIDGK